MATITKKYGESVTLTATPNSGYEFSSWSGDASGSTNPLTITVTGDRTITANFSASVQNVIRYTLTPGSAALTGDWITNNTDTSRNTYDSTTGEGVFYLNSGAMIGGPRGTWISSNYTPFYQCNSLEIIDLSDYRGDIGQAAFRQCSNLSSITFSNNIINIYYDAFDRCSSLTSITIPSSVTFIENGAFMDCSGLTSLTVDSNNITYDSRNNCKAIIETSTNTLIVGCKNTSIPSSVTSIGNYAFRGCTGLTSITIPSAVTSIGSDAFYKCTGLTGNLTIPSAVTSIGNDAFSKCINITKLYIGNYTNGSNITTIGMRAFYNDDISTYSLSDVYIYKKSGAVPTLRNYNFVKTRDTLHVMPAMLSAFRTDSAWSEAFETIQSM